MRGLLLALLLLASPAMAQPTSTKYGPGDCPFGASSCLAKATGGTTPRTLADHGADALSVKDFGAKCDGTTDDSAAFQAAANLGQRISVPAGICRINATINVVTGTQFVGRGRPGQFSFVPTTGTTLDFIGAPANSDGFAAAGAVQMVYFSDLQIERAPRHGVNLSAVYFGVDRVSFAYNGGDGLHLFDSYLAIVSNSFFEFNTGNGFVDTGSSQYTTLQVNNSESTHNSGDGWYVASVNSAAFVTTGADTNGGYGYDILRNGSTDISSVGFYSTDSESNAKSGYYFSHATATLTSATAAANNTSATAGEANFALADQASNVTITSSYDLASTTANSLNATNSSVISGQNNTWKSATPAASGSRIANMGQFYTSFPSGGSLGFTTTSTSVNYALYGDTTNTILNVPTGGQIHFRSNNVEKVTVDGATGNITTVGSVQLAQSTVALLPTCNAALKGGLYGVTDATAPTYNAALTGGGAVVIPVYCNGSAWTAH